MDEVIVCYSEELSRVISCLSWDGELTRKKPKKSKQQAAHIMMLL